MESPVPRLTTPRLVLRGYERRDFEPYFRNAEDPEANAFMGGSTDRRQAWRLFSAASGTWVIDGAGWWAVADPVTDEMVGTVGAFFREKDPEQLEVGWVIFRPYWKRGYASEAAKAALAYAMPRHRKERAIAYIAPENAASIAVSVKLGMTFDGPSDFYGEPCNRYALVAR